jgi:hypothetical protein
VKVYELNQEMAQQPLANILHYFVDVNSTAVVDGNEHSNS